MPESNAYRANVGGIMGSGERFDSRPEIDVAGAIGQLGQLYRNNREDVLNRAVTQAHLKIAQAQSDREDQAQELALRNAGWRPPEEIQAQQAPAPSVGAPPAPSAPIPPLGADPSMQGAPPAGPVGPVGPINVPQNGMAGSGGPSLTATSGVPVPPMAAPIPQPQSPISQPPAQAPTVFGGTGKYAHWQLGTPVQVQRQMDARRSALQSIAAANPGVITPQEVELGVHDDHAFDQLIARHDKLSQSKSAAQDRYNSLDGAMMPDGKTPMTEQLRKALSTSEPLYNKYHSDILNPQRDPVATHQAERDYDIAHPTRGESNTADTKLEDKADKYITSRITKLTAPQSDGLGGKTAGMDWDKAHAQAVEEVKKLYPKAAGHFTEDEPPAGPAAAPKKTGGTGNIDLSQHAGPATHAEIDANAAAAIRAGADPAAVAARTNQLHAQLMKH